MPIVRDEVYVDANTGALLYRNPIIKHANRLVSKAESEQIAKQVEQIVIGTNKVQESKKSTRIRERYCVVIFIFFTATQL